MNPEPRPWSTPVARLFLYWLVLALALTGGWHSLSYAVPAHYRNEFLAFKLGLLGVLAALSTFQWGWWQGFAQGAVNDLYDPAWMAWLRRLRVNPECQTNADQRRQLARWLRGRRMRARQVLDSSLRPNRFSLTTMASAVYLLILSLLADLVSIFDAPSPASHAISLGAFTAAAFASIVLWCAHLYSISYEFDGWERAFRSALRRHRDEG